MGLKIFVKRIVPFLATFAVGLFIAGFFVTISAPSFRIGGRGFERRQRVESMQLENQQLRENSCQMKRRIAELEQQKSDPQVNVEYSLDVPPPPPLPLAPMKAPAAPKVR